MPLTASGLTFYEQEFETGLFSGLAQNVAAFNEASGGAITLTQGDAERGRLPQKTFFSRVSGLVQQRDPSGTGNLTPATFANKGHGSVNVFHKAVLDFRKQDFLDQGLDTQEGAMLFGEMYAEELSLVQLNSSLSAALGAIGAVDALTPGTAIYDGSGGTMDYSVLNEARFLMGDRVNVLRAVISHSKPMRDLAGQALNDQVIAFQLSSEGGGNVTVFGAMPALMGYVPVMTDAAPLFVAGAPNLYNTMVLAPGSVEIKTGESEEQFNYVTGAAGSAPENDTWRLSIESSFEITVRGASYTAAANPPDATLALPGSWTSSVGDDPVKQGPGILIRTQ